MSANVRQVALPPGARRLGTLPRIDYSDAFVIETSRERTPEQWARAMLEGAPQRWRHGLPWGWRSLGLRHGPITSPHCVLGWPVRHHTDDFLLLGADSRLGMPAELLFERHPQGLLFATLVQHANLGVRAAWAAIAPGHRRVVRHLLEHVADQARCP